MTYHRKDGTTLRQRFVSYASEGLADRAEMAAKAAGYPSLSAATEAFWAYLAQDPDAVCPRPVTRRFRRYRRPA
jgi:hypothetical protein